MYLRDLANSLLRRWYFVLLALVMTAGVCLFASTKISPTYETNASVVLIPPKSLDDPTANRFLALGGLSQAVEVLVRSLNADSNHEVVKALAPDGKFEVTTDAATSAPVVLITASAGKAREATELVDAVLAQIPTDLSALQAKLSIKQTSEITTIPVARDAKPKVVQKKRLRALALLAIMCMGGGAVLIGALDGLLLVRSRRKEVAGGTGGELSEVSIRHGKPGTDDDTWIESELAAISQCGMDSGRPIKRVKGSRREGKPSGGRK